MPFYDEELDLDILKPYFKREELASKADGSFKLAPNFAEQLVRLRIKYGKPMIITSGCRTQADIELLKSEGRPVSENSFHLISNPKYNGLATCAVDVAIEDSKDRANLLRLALQHNWCVGIAKNFIHLDRRRDYTSLPQVAYIY